jgi:hypothetical protein
MHLAGAPKAASKWRSANAKESRWLFSSYRILRADLPQCKLQV